MTEWLVALIACAVVLFATAETSAEPVVDTKLVPKSVVSLGDTARVRRVLAKARRGEKVVVGVIGGSITQGASASAPENRYGNLVAQWWRETFPKAQIEFVNAGIGATGSDLGAHRAGKQLLVHKPDFVVAEYAVNDADTRLAAETLEGLVRQILKQPNQPALMLLFTMNENGTNAQKWHSAVGYRYDLPMVSFRDAVYPEVEAGRMKIGDVLADVVHPNDVGHRYCAESVINVLRTVLTNLPADNDLPAIPPIPRPLISDAFEHAAIYSADDISPVTNQGWAVSGESPWGKSWETSTPGSALEFEVEGDSVYVVFFRIKGDMGIAEATVDGRPPVRLDGWFEADWGGYFHPTMLGRDLGQGKHCVKIRLLEENAGASKGNRFQLAAVMVAGKS